MKSLKELLDIEDKWAIHCPTLEEAKLLLEEADILSLKWSNGDSYITSDNHWHIYKQDTCYNLKEGRFSGINFYQKENYKIIEFKEINMKRNISVNLDTAKEWYKQGGTLREVALQAFTEAELKPFDYTQIKTFEDACNALGIYTGISVNMPTNAYTINDHLIAIYKLDIIRKALNKDWKPSLAEGRVYWPYVKFYPAGEKAREAVRSNNWKVCQTFYADGKKYSLVGGGSYPCCGAGLGGFSFGYGHAYADLGLLGCKSKEIAEHMSTYFAKEIFEACYAQHFDLYKFID